LRAPASDFFQLRSRGKVVTGTFSYVGENHFVYATDIPHWDCEFPANLQHTQERKDLSDGTKNKILYENVKALYGI
jgi:predicted TIM-barrel fold metal-dependent hydrolase